MSIHGAHSSTSSPRVTSPGAVPCPPDGTTQAGPEAPAAAVRVRGLVKTYHAGIAGCSARVEALRGADLDIERGSVLGILGPPGAGKSTLLLCVAGLLRADAGRVEWFGRPCDGAGRPPGIAYVPERAPHYSFMTVREAVEYHLVLRDGAQRAGDDAVDAALASTSLLDRASVRISELPWNVLPQVSIAQGLVGAPRVLILDESLSGLAPPARRDIARALRAEAAAGTAVVVASDTFEVLEGLAPRVAIVIEGRVSAPVDAITLRRTSMLELTVATPAVARRLLDVRVAEAVWDRQVVRVSLDGTTPEAILARCRACGIRVEGSRIVPGGPAD